MPSGHEMSRAGRALRFDKELPVGTNGLEAVVFEDDGSSCKQAQEKRSNRWSGEMNHIGPANQPPEFNERGLANYAERRLGVVKISLCGLRHQRDFKLARTSGIAKFREPACKGKNDGFHSPDAGSKEMRVDE